ncbi:Crp/Fnr family transcriptional regulator [Nocardia sp. NPDC058058]|uniref:Crp/Fnr family transcriptional regulator n=1 Tax=Nocardia sp. NPDC058058 TaxID=3346317 RepID=UPI0036DAFA20
MVNLDSWPWPENTLLARLSPRSRRELLGLGHERYCKPGTLLMRQGDPGNTVYVLRSHDTSVSACVKITADAGTLFAIRVSGDVIGELGALTPNSVRSATATVCTATIAHCIPGNMFLSFLNEHPDGWQTLCRTLADRLAWSDQRRLDFGGWPVRRCLARLLVEFAESYGRPSESGVEITVRLSYEELGNLIGAGEDAVGLAMKRMQTKDLVCLRSRHVVVRDLEGLRNYAELE